MWIIILQNISTILPLKNSGGRNVAAIIYAIASGGIRRRGYVRIEHEAGGRSESETRGRIGTNAERVPARG